MAVPPPGVEMGAQALDIGQRYRADFVIAHLFGRSPSVSIKDVYAHPTVGEPQYIARPVVDLLFPPGAPSRVPIVAVTGTNGKTTTARMIAHIMKGVGRTSRRPAAGAWPRATTSCSSPASAATIRC